MDNQKPIKQSTLFTYLTKRCKYSEEEVTNFFKAIEIDLYDPIIQYDRKAQSKQTWLREINLSKHAKITRSWLLRVCFIFCSLWRVILFTY
jgi:hypothetical protein